MKKIKILSFLIFVFSIAVFAGSIWTQLQNRDTEGPRIYMDQEQIEVSIHDSEEVLLEGVTAEDNKDGDVTDSIVVESISEFVDDNTRIVNYAAFDRSNHVSKAFRRLVYSDYTPIQLSLTEPLRFPMSNSSSVNVLENIEAVDCLDGDISEKVTLSSDSSIMMDMASEYPVTIQVTNSVGDTAEFPVTVTIYDQAVENSAPQFTLTDYLIYTKKNSPIDAYSYVESVKCKGGVYEPTSGRGTYGVDTSDMDAEERAAFQKEDPAISIDYIQVTDNIDYSVPGVYEIKYTMKDEDGNIGSMFLIVIVEEE